MTVYWGSATTIYKIEADSEDDALEALRDADNSDKIIRVMDMDFSVEEGY